MTHSLMKAIGHIKRYTPKWVKKGALIIKSFPFFVIFILKKQYIFLRWFSSDVNIFYHTFIKNEFGINQNLDNIKFVIDAGANTGLTSLFFNYKYPSSKIIAIEPEQNNFNFLVKNTRNNNNIYPLKRGVWYKDTHLKICNPNAQSWAFTTQEVNEDTNSDVRGISIPTILKKYNSKTIDLLKIDIEGAEKELFKNNIDLWLPHTRYLVIELHGPECRKIVQQMLEKYRFVQIYKNGENIYYQNTRLQ